MKFPSPWKKKIGKSFSLKNGAPRTYKNCCCIGQAGDVTIGFLNFRALKIPYI